MLTNVLSCAVMFCCGSQIYLFIGALIATKVFVELLMTRPCIPLLLVTFTEKFTSLTFYIDILLCYNGLPQVYISTLSPILVKDN